jgi:hypothetical protein
LRQRYAERLAARDGFADAGNRPASATIGIDIATGYQCIGKRWWFCKARYKNGPFPGLKRGQSLQTKSLDRGRGVIGVGEAAVA